MKRSLKNLAEYTLKTKDGTNGKVSDFLFDEKQWTVRYLRADFGSLFSSKKILIPKVFLKTPLWEKEIFPSELEKNDIENCPKPADHQPVSRKYENTLFKYFKINPYWSASYVGSPGLIYPPMPVDIPTKDFHEEDLDTILRSFKEIEGYDIHAIDGKLGHIEDVIIDDSDWQIKYVIIDTKNWLPFSKKVIIAINWMESVSYERREAKINLKTEVIKNAPEFHSTELIDSKFEKSLFDFYSRSLVK
ncbi:MAG: PRC-barrel domain-containing protein [Bacteroidetes bacterium]|jgi:sporulation protein YlmC with PRC-barrel domain|nr:PRC-barrel domain-containing protein [Bacteroidota bacterium]